MSLLYMNSTIDVLFKHRTVRRYLPDPIPPEHRLLMEKAAQQAATSCTGQLYTFISVASDDIKGKIISSCGNQRFLREAPLFYVVCADLYRLDLISSYLGGKNNLGSISGLQIAAVDAALAAQNLVICAESLGYGTSYCGSCGDGALSIIEILDLPAGVVPLFGLVVGASAEDPPSRPRIDHSLIFHEDGYKEYSKEDLDKSISMMVDGLEKEGYYRKYSKRDNFLWSDHIIRKFGGEWLDEVEKTRFLYTKKHLTLDERAKAVSQSRLFS